MPLKPSLDIVFSEYETTKISFNWSLFMDLRNYHVDLENRQGHVIRANIAIETKENDDEYTCHFSTSSRLSTYPALKVFDVADNTKLYLDIKGTSKKFGRRFVATGLDLYRTKK